MYHVILFLGLIQGGAVYQKCSGVSREDAIDRLQQIFDGVFGIVAGVDHPGDIRIFNGGVAHAVDQFVKNQEQLVGFDAARGQVVVAVHRAIEVETTQATKMHEATYNLLNVGIGQMVPQIDQYLRIFTHGLAQRVGGAPVRDDHGVKIGLVRFVLDEHGPIIGHGTVNVGKGFGGALVSAAQVVLSGEIGTIGEPDGQHFGIQLFAVLYTLDVVVNGLLADDSFRVAKGAEFIAIRLVFLVLKSIGIDRIDGQAVVRKQLFEGGYILGNVPGNVQGDGIG